MNHKIYNIKFLFFFAFILSTLKVAAQSDPIQLDRPDQTECSYIVPTGYIQFEAGFTSERSNTGPNNLVFPSVLWKYGLNKRFEFRLITELGTFGPITGINPITIGFKTAICEEKGLIPKTSIIAHISTAKLGHEALQTSYPAPSFRFTMQNSISKRVSLSYNLGAEWDGERTSSLFKTSDPTYIYTLTTGIALTEKLGGYLELYGFLPRTTPADHNFDAGLTYLINHNCMVDLSASISLENPSFQNYISIGYSYRFKVARNNQTSIN